MGNDTISYQTNNEIFDVKIKVENNYIHYVLLKLGVPPHLKGYSYIVYALELVLIDPNLLQHITKELYIDVAKKYDTTPSRVERAIRHAITTTFQYGNKEFINSVFQNCLRPDRPAPTNTMFLARLYYYLTLVN